MKCTVNFIWDKEAAVWIATSEDVKGLVLEDGSLDKLMYRVEQAVPELLELNQLPNILKITEPKKSEDCLLIVCNCLKKSHST